MLTPDHKWMYPQKWEHYIIEHSVKPDNEHFIQDAIVWYNRTYEGELYD